MENDRVDQGRGEETMNIAQLEHADICSELLNQSPRERLELLFREMRGATITLNTKRMQMDRFDHKFADTEAQFADYRNELSYQLSRAAARLAEINQQIDQTILEAAEVIKAGGKANEQN